MKSGEVKLCVQYVKTELPKEGGCTPVIVVLPLLCFPSLVLVELFHEPAQQQKPVGAASKLNHLTKGYWESKLLELGGGVNGRSSITFPMWQ